VKLTAGAGTVMVQKASANTPQSVLRATVKAVCSLSPPFKQWEPAPFVRRATQRTARGQPSTNVPVLKGTRRKDTIMRQQNVMTFETKRSSFGPHWVGQARGFRSVAVE